MQVETVDEGGTRQHHRRARVGPQRVHRPRPDPAGHQAAGPHLPGGRPGRVRPRPVHRGAARGGRQGRRQRAAAQPTAELPEAESYAKLTRVAMYRSPPLSEALKVTLKVSHNLYASTLPLLLAVKDGKRTLADGMRLQGKVLAELGVDVEGDLAGVRRRRRRRRQGVAARHGAAAAGDAEARRLAGVRGGAAGAGRGRHAGDGGRARTARRRAR